MAFFGLFNREKKETLDKGLEKSKESVLSKIGHAIAGKSTIDDDVLDNLEEALITSDVGVETTLRIIERVQERVKRDKYIGTEELNGLLVDEISQLLQENNVADVPDFEAPLPAKPYVVMVVGVNGVGKTTTVAKLAATYANPASNGIVQHRMNVRMITIDIFRIAARQQIETYGEIMQIPVDTVDKLGDLEEKITRMDTNTDVILIDTIGFINKYKLFF